ncbi:MAG: hypothetical protein WDO24_02335 [Pseudomonadota bacterium]
MPQVPMIKSSMSFLANHPLPMEVARSRCCPTAPRSCASGPRSISRFDYIGHPVRRPDPADRGGRPSADRRDLGADALLGRGPGAPARRDQHRRGQAAPA